MKRMHGPRRPFRHFGTALLVVVMTVACTSGCGGPSTEDLMMRAAQRRRPSDKNQLKQAEKKGSLPEDAITKKQSHSNASNQVTTVSSDSDTEKTPITDKPARITNFQQTQPSSGPAETEIPPPPTTSVLPIGQRKPEKALDQESRENIAIENIQAIATALQNHFNKTGRFPSSYSTSPNGLPTLSWRVRLLPFLGQNELYQKFDFNKPWDVEPNRSLLQFIPDVYVSPERFDTNTNYLLPTGRKFLFGENRTPREKIVEDGLDNTLMLFEVNEEHAVPWTKPADFAAETAEDVSDGIGNLRLNGTFAIWANGLPTLLQKSLKPEQVFRATTYESGDALRAVEIHRELESTFRENTHTNTGDRNASKSVPDQPPQKLPTVLPTVLPTRAPIPEADEIADAERKARHIYSSRILSAKAPIDKIELANDLLKDALNISSDKAGVYVLQTAAMRLAVESESAATLIKGIDQRVSMFEVPPYEENISWLLQLKKTPGNKNSRTLGNRKFIARAVLVAHSGMDKSDYSRAAALIGLAYRFCDQEPHEVLPSLLNQFSLLLSSADRQFAIAAQHLAAHRKDPSNVQAAAACGQFLCFIQGDWQSGLPLLAENGNEILRTIARADLRAVSSTDEQVAIGDQWWELSERANTDAYQQAARERAVHWYAQALRSMPESLDRIHVKNRLDSYNASKPASSIDLCRELADQLEISLENGLQAQNTETTQRSNEADHD